MKRGYIKTYAKILFIIFMIIAIICAIGYFFKNEYDAEQYETIKTDMLLISAKTKIIAEKINMKEKDAAYVGRSIDEVKDEEEIRNLQERGIINLDEKNNIYYILEKNHLEEMGLTTINIEEGRYIVEYNNNEIIYTKGIQDKNGNILYKLSEM